ncbi:uncharacterized protein cusr [Lampris incognitus]|uniref:uncharacterized protein cusr n=1 Tax=Lampris incognitus TaxID=2546036 RepID=UPI0024B5135E|nr:uncharacterized protein cusr [Lampris incognitus]
MDNRKGTHCCHCENVGDTYNPFNMMPKSPSCTRDSPLGCMVGEMTERQGPIRLTERQVFSDTIIMLAGDYTVVHRSLVLKDGDRVLTCADILPTSPSAEQIFPKVTLFSRYDFRRRVADVLNVALSRITILPDSPRPTTDTTCQQVSYLVSGDVSLEQLDTVKTSEKMGKYKGSDSCNSKWSFL